MTNKKRYFTHTFQQFFCVYKSLFKGFKVTTNSNLVFFSFVVTYVKQQSVSNANFSWISRIIFDMLQSTVTKLSNAKLCMYLVSSSVKPRESETIQGKGADLNVATEDIVYIRCNELVLWKHWKQTNMISYTVSHEFPQTAIPIRTIVCMVSQHHDLIHFCAGNSLELCLQRIHLVHDDGCMEGSTKNLIYPIVLRC